MHGFACYLTTFNPPPASALVRHEAVHASALKMASQPGWRERRKHCAQTLLRYKKSNEHKYVMITRSWLLLVSSKEYYHMHIERRCHNDSDL